MSKIIDYIVNNYNDWDNNVIGISFDNGTWNLKKISKLFAKELEKKDQRIAELEKENKRLNTKLEIWNRFDKEDYIHGGEKATERDYYYYTNGVSAVLENEVKQLKSEQNKVAECTLIDGYNCSLCGASQADIRKKYSNFCSNCGAKIKREKRDE